MLYWHTVRHLKMRQIFWRIFYRFTFSLRPRLQSSSKCRNPDAYDKWLIWAKNTNSYFGDGEFLLLNQKVVLQSASDWNDSKSAKLLTYNLHYFDDLNSCNFVEKVEQHSALINSWIAENPPVVGDGWEPYPTSLRIVNWIRWSLNRKQPLTDNALKSLSLQVSWLMKHIEYHILGNHILANAKALLFAGCYLESEQVTKALKIGLKLLDKELDEQILSDGAHFELSPMYHCIVLEDVLDLINLANTYPQCIPSQMKAKLMSKASDMFSWLEGMTHPDGGISFFNDAALGIAKSPDQLKCYAEKLQVDLSDQLPTNTMQSGYYRLANLAATLICDAAAVGPDYLPGHAHADTLSFELSVDGHRAFVNSGTSVYGSGELRHQQRSTESHNTVVVDGLNSSEVWGGFRVARRARVRSADYRQEEKSQFLSAIHDGYNSVLHQRSWELFEGHLVIKDKLHGSHNFAKSYLHLHPDIKFKMADEKTVCLHYDSAPLATLNVRKGTLTVEPSKYWPEFGVELENQRFSIDLIYGEADILIEFAANGQNAK